MELTFDKIYQNLSNIYLPGFLAFSISFASVGFKEIRQKGYDGIIYFILALFFITAHYYLLFDHPYRIPLGITFEGISIFQWVEFLLCPCIIALFLLNGLYSFYKTKFKDGLVKIFFGLTLYCYLYMLGNSWPVNLKAGLILSWFVVFFLVEIKSMPRKS